jgi:hypothetical protein
MKYLISMNAVVCVNDAPGLAAEINFFSTAVVLPVWLRSSINEHHCFGFPQCSSIKRRRLHAGGVWAQAVHLGSWCSKPVLRLAGNVAAADFLSRKIQAPGNCGGSDFRASIGRLGMGAPTRQGGCGEMDVATVLLAGCCQLSGPAVR